MGRETHPATAQGTQDALLHQGFHIRPDADMNLHNNGGVMAKTPYGEALLTDGPEGRGLDFDELRHYRPGDDIRTMDWRVTNRTGKPHVRVYTEERDRPALIVVDVTEAFVGPDLPVREAQLLSRQACGERAWRAIPNIALAYTASWLRSR